MENQEMNENCVKAGKKKKKKKKKAGGNGEQGTSTDTSQTLKESNCYFSVADMLPQKVGEKTVFKDLEVTLTQGTQSQGISIPVKEKKKKDQHAVNPLTSAVNSLTSANQVKQSSAVNDQAKQLPVVSVPANFTKNPDVSIIPCNNKAGGSTAVEGSNQTPDGAVPKKKKKKKKKKKNSSELPAPSSSKNEDEAIVTPPTCVKLQAEGDSCVLLVSHESFGSSRFPSEQRVCEGAVSIANKNKGTIKLKAPPNAQNQPNSSLLNAYNSSYSVLKPQHGEVPIDQEASLLNLTSASYAIPSSQVPLCQQNMYNGSTETSSVAKSVDDIGKTNGTASCLDLPAALHAGHNDQTPVQNAASGPSVNEVANPVPNPASTNCESSVPPEGSAQEPTKAQLRAARRALQEAQRAAKLAAKNEKAKTQSSAVADQVKPPSTDKAASKDTEKVSEKPVPATVTTKPVSKEPSKIVQEKEKSRRLRLFAHLPQVKSFDTVLQLQTGKVAVHSAVLAVGAQYARGIICGSNARCIALLSALKMVINDYVTPPNKELSRDLAEKLQMNMNFLASCRPLSVSMVNAVKFLKQHIRNISSEMSDNQAKDILLNCIANFIREEIFLAKEAICTFVEEHINDGDVILTYAYSSLVEAAVQRAFSVGKKFRVIVVDSQPKMEGRETLRSFVKIGIPCTYLLINAVPYIMKEVTTVILGAHALQANGSVVSRVGASQVALVASAYNVHTLVCCETYKFCEKVHTDSFVYNELGDPHNLVNIHNKAQHCHLQNWKDIPSLQLLNLLYDVTPPDLVSMVLTEKGVLPCTAVPVFLRVRHAGSQDQQ